MPEIVWPPSLPNVMSEKTSIEDSLDVIKTEMDVGYPKRRRRSSTVIEIFSTALILNGDQKETLRTFVRDTLRGGTLPFSWTGGDPATDGDFVGNAYIRNEKLKFEMFVPGKDPNSERWWTVVLDIEAHR